MREPCIVLDALVTDAKHYPDLVVRPMSTIARIRGRVQAWGRFAGSERVRHALDRVRLHVDSPGETRPGLAIVDAGLPEPVMQVEVMADGGLVAAVDLAYPEPLIAIEHEGDGHRERRQ